MKDQILEALNALAENPQILIKNLENEQWLSFKEFLEGFQIKTPEGFYQGLGEDFTLFAYSQATDKRLGFIIKIGEKENFKNLLESWEETMEEDFGNLFFLMGKEGSALIPIFRDANYKGVVFRYQTFSKKDLGICYSIFQQTQDGELTEPISEEFFIFTSSYESMTKVIDKLYE